MAVKGKGKEVDTPSSSKRKASTSASASKRRRSGVLKFVDDAAYVAEDDEDEDDSDSDEDLDDFFEELAKEGDAPVSEPKGKGKGFLPFLVKEEELSGDELEALIKERYDIKSGLKYAGYEDEFEDMAGPDPTKDPTIWRLKCGVGREREVAFCFMQKYVEFHNRGNKLQVFSAFAVDHVKGYVYVEADKAGDVTEACKGFCNVYVTRINAVPASEVPHLLAIRSKPSVISEGAWVRLKNGNYKGDIAQVVNVDDGRKKVLIKLVPRIDLQAISKKFGGAISLKNATIPTARRINPRELEVFRPHIEIRRDRQSGETFEVLDGNMIKDGYLFKRVALSSLIYWGVEPTDSERVKFSPPSVEGQEVDPDDWVSDLCDSHRKKKSRASTSADLKASTSEPMDDNAFGIHDLVLFGKKGFGVILGTEKDGLYKLLTGDMEGTPVVTIKKHEIKKVCADKMFTALDRNKKLVCINDPVEVSEGPTEGKKGIVKHMFKGVLFIRDENKTENGGFFCAKAEQCVNTKKSQEVPPPPMQAFSENFDENAGPSFPPSPGLFQSSWQQDNERGSGSRRQERESLFSIGQILRIRKGPLKGYLCRVVRMYRNDITVKLDSLVKILTVDAEYLTAPTKKGQADESGAACASDMFGVQGTEGGSSWDTGLPSFTSDAWQPFSSSTAPTSGAGGDSAGGDGDPWGSKVVPSGTTDAWNSDKPSDTWGGDGDPWGSKVVPSGTTTDAWNSDKPSDTWGNTSDKQATHAGTSTQNGTWQKDDDSTWGNSSSQKNMAGDSGWVNEKGKDAVSDDPWGTFVSKGPEEGADAWDSKGKGVATEDAWGKSKVEAEGGSWKQDTSSDWDAKEKGLANEDNSAWGDKVRKSQDTDAWGGKSDGWGQSTKKNGGGEGGGGWNTGGSASWDKPNSSTWNSGQDDGGDKGNQPMDSWNTGGGFEGRGSRGGGGSGRGGGRSGGSGGRDCYKCGQSGHFSRECPSAGNGGSRGGGGNCYKCGESGHFARECPSADGGGSRSGGGGGGNCYKCGQSGHFSRECPSADGGGSRAGGGGSGNCYKCGESGHLARECPSAEGGGSRSGGGGASNCYKCGESGHFARECPSAAGGGSRGGVGNCYKCGESGHFARECPSADGGASRGGGGGSGRDCFKCRNPGHFARECPNEGGEGGGTWKSNASDKPSFGSSWSNDQAGDSTMGKMWGNSQGDIEKRNDWSSSSWSKNVSEKKTTGGADSWNAPTPPAAGELQGDDPWAANLTPALTPSTHTTNAWSSNTEGKAHNSWDNNQKSKEHDPWGSNQKTEAEAKEADTWGAKATHDTVSDKQDDPWSTKKMEENNAATEAGGWNAGGSSHTQSDGWGKSGNESDWSKPRVSLASGYNDNNNDGSGWGRPSWSSDSGGRGRGRGRGRSFGDRNDGSEGGRGGRGRNFGDRDDGNNGGRGSNWRGRGGGQYGGSRGGRGGRNGGDSSSTWNEDGNKSYDSLSFSAWNQGSTDKESGWGNSGGDKNVESGWGDVGDEKKKENSWNDAPSSSAGNQVSAEKACGWGNANEVEKGNNGEAGGWGNSGVDKIMKSGWGDEKKKGNSWNDAPSFSAGNQVSAEKGSGWGNANEVEKGNNGEAGGWDKGSGEDNNGGW